MTYYGKGRMPVRLLSFYLADDRMAYEFLQGFGENYTPRGQCTFGARLQEEEIKLLTEFVKGIFEKGNRKILK